MTPLLTAERLRELEEAFSDAREPWRSFGLELARGVRDAQQTATVAVDDHDPLTCEDACLPCRSATEASL